MRVSRLMIGALWLYSVLLWTGYALAPAAPYVSATGMVLATLIAIVLILLLATMRAQDAPMQLLLTFVTVVFFLLRYLSLVVFADEIKFERAYISFVVGDVDAALLYILLGTLILGLGFRFGSKLRVGRGGGPPADARPLAVPVWMTCVLFIALCSMETWAFFDVGKGRLSELWRDAGWIRYPLMFVDGDVGLIVGSVLIGERWSSLKRRDYGWVALAAIAYFANRSITGGKGGMYYLLLYPMLFVFVRQGDFRIPMRRLAVWTPVILTATLASVFIAKSTRPVFEKQLKTYSDVALSPTDLIDVARDNTIDAEELFQTIYRRLNALDSLVLVLQRTDPERIQQFMSPAILVENTINLLLPGTYFDDVVPSSRAFGIVYFDWYLWEVENYYRTDLFTVYGNFFVYLGWFGGLIGCLLTAIVLGTVWRWLSLRQTRFRPVFQMLFMVSLYWLLISFGFDEVLFLTCEVAAVGALYLTGLLWVSRKKKLPTPLVTPYVLATPYRTQP